MVRIPYCQRLSDGISLLMRYAPEDRSYAQSLIQPLLLKLFLQRDRTEAAWLLLRALRFDAQLRPPSAPTPEPARPGPVPAVPEWSAPVALFLERVSSGSTFPLDGGAVRCGPRRSAGPRGFGALLRPAAPRNGALEAGRDGGKSGNVEWNE